MKATSVDMVSGSGVRARIAEWFAASAWAPLAGKVLAYLVGFGVLALVGSGAAEGVLSSITGARASPSNSASVPAAPSSVAPLVLRANSAASADTGTDAGTAMDTATGTATGTGTGTGAATGAATGTGAIPATPPASGITPDGKVVLNAATEEDLRRLPGIGPSKAKAILALRAKLGRFRRAEDLLRVKGIGRRKLARLRPLLVVEPPPG